MALTETPAARIGAAAPDFRLPDSDGLLDQVARVAPRR